jgi:hypothetical protein
MRGLFRHLSVALLAATTIATPRARAQAVPPAHTATFDVVVRGANLGFETVTVSGTGTGWQIASSGRLGAPTDQTTNKFEVTYAADWQPQRLTIEGVARGQIFSLSATFTSAAASITVDQGGQRRMAEQKVSPRTIVLPPNIFGAYEALAMQLSTAAVGTRWPVYVTADVEISVTLNTVTPRRFTAPTGQVDLRECDVTFEQPAGFSTAEVWIDRDGHLARFVLPAQGVSLLRNDLTSVMMREERVTHAGDEAVFIPSSGFSLAATMTKPPGVSGRLPAVVLVAGAGTLDRDETTAGIPVFGQLAGALADAGYAVVRYDQRGTGQSGGRTESATLTSYADDVSRVIEWLMSRKDVDPNRIAVVGYGDGGSLALVAAGRGKAIRAVALLATAGRTGREVALEQQQKELARLAITDADKAAKIALQTRLLDAAATGKGWDAVPGDVRKASDTPWFRSWVLFDPVAALAKLSQPVLIVHGALDRQVPAAHADRLESASRARKQSPVPSTRKAVIPGVNHLFVAAATGEVGEYAALPVKTISPALASALTAWMQDVLVAKK